ncbi:MAG: extracellular solute-binding protein [Lachnospiraceae bacterium]|nr:extracellular solute-binding protein [Lachnospiraceae bacterium]
MPKQTRLNDSAEIYNRHREEKTEKEKWSEMNRKERYEYFKSYYLPKIALIATIIVLVGSLLYSMLKPKPDTLIYAAIFDYAMTEDMVDTIETEFSEYINLDPETQEIYFDTSFVLSFDDDYSLHQKLSTYLFAGEIDVMIGSESQIKQHIQSGYITPLSEQLPTELYTALKDCFVYASVPVTDDLGNITEWGEEKVYGLYLDGCAIYDGYTLIERPILAIVANSDQKDNAVEFIKYLFDK